MDSGLHEVAGIMDAKIVEEHINPERSFLMLALE
jgi:hypothetical protein